jgi:hypothetical protein
MKLNVVFIGKAEPLAEQYEGLGQTSFVVQDERMAPGCAPALVVPGIGDLVQLRMHPGPDIRTFLCTGRLFDFSERGSPMLELQLDMA